MPKLTVICHTRSQPWGYGHHTRGSRRQQRIHINVTRPVISTHPPRRTESWRIGDGDFSFDASKIETSRGPPSNGVCSRSLVKSRASSESRISPLTASAVTRATTSLQSRELMFVRVHAASFLLPARPISCSIRARLTPFGRAPT